MSGAAEAELKEPPMKRAKGVTPSLVKNPSVQPTWHNLGLMGFAPSDFRDVKYVCLMGTAIRAAEFSGRVAQLLGLNSTLVTNAERYSVFLTGPVLTANHGIGNASISVLLHDLLKLLHFAGASDVNFVRLGTCGGLGIKPGTIVVSTKIVNEYGVSELDVPILGVSHKRPTIVSADLAQALVDLASRQDYAEGVVNGSNGASDTRSLCVITGTTMCCNGFFEEQCRRDGAICEVAENAQREYLQSLYDQGVRNIEMESAALSAFCHHLGIRCGVLSTVLVDRLKGDVVSDVFTHSPTEDAQLLLLRHIKNDLKL